MFAADCVLMVYLAVNRLAYRLKALHERLARWEFG